VNSARGGLGLPSLSPTRRRGNVREVGPKFLLRGGERSPAGRRLLGRPTWTAVPRGFGWPTIVGRRCVVRGLETADDPAGSRTSPPCSTPPRRTVCFATSRVVSDSHPSRGARSCILREERMRGCAASARSCPRWTRRSSRGSWTGPTSRRRVETTQESEGLSDGPVGPSPPPRIDGHE